MANAIKFKWLRRPDRRPDALCLVCGFVAVSVVWAALAHSTLIKHAAKDWVEHTEDVIDELDLDKRADLFSAERTSNPAQKLKSAHHKSAAVALSMGGTASQPDNSEGGKDHSKGGKDHMKDAHDKPEKQGAGLLFVSHPEGLVLLLQRRSKHNDKTWGFPGGNADPEDGGDLLATAKREALEEMGQLPSEFNIKGSIMTRRGKRGQKHYTVFVAEVPSEVQKQYVPVLDTKEHSDWRWFSLKALTQMKGSPLGPLAGVQLASDGVVGAEKLQGVELHPVVDMVVSNQHRQQLLQLTAAAPAM